MASSYEINIDFKDFDFFNIGYISKMYIFYKGNYFILSHCVSAFSLNLSVANNYHNPRLSDCIHFKSIRETFFSVFF